MNERAICICSHQRRSHSSIAATRTSARKAWCSGRVACPCHEFVLEPGQGAYEHADREWQERKDGWAKGRAS